MIITIDGGTTNTRVYLWENENTVIAESRSQIGARNTAVDGSNQRLKEEVKRMIGSVLEQGNALLEDVEAIYASGMITSDLGLVELPHLIAPASIEDFAAGVKTVLIKDVCEKEISFIPGLKNIADKDVNLENVRNMDMMRGEETEAVGLLAEVDEPNLVLILPGTHTKIVVVKDGKMTGCLTSLTGELLQLLTENSIVADAVDKRFVSGDPDREYFLAGARDASKVHSLGRVAFSTRICSKFVSAEQEKCASFLLGAVLENDVEVLKNGDLTRELTDAKVLIAGKEPLAGGMKLLLEEDGTFKNVSIYKTGDALPLSGKGAWAIYKSR